MNMVKKRRSAALADRDRAQGADAQVPHQALRVQNARRAVREARPVRARQDGKSGAGMVRRKFNYNI